MGQNSVADSGLPSEDWCALRDVLLPFLHAEQPAQVGMPEGLPAHLVEHPLVGLVRRYRETGDKSFLDAAGRLLIPTEEPFAWYLALTK